MIGHVDTERILDAFLAPEADRLAERVIDAALDQIARTPQRRAFRVPWRFPTMPARSRASGLVAVALVAFAGAGGLMYLNATGRPGGSPTPTTAPTSGATAAPTAEPTAAPSFVAPGITGWKTYTSAVYGYTISYPEDWSVAQRATQRWLRGELPDAPSSDIFFNNAPAAAVDNSMAFLALRIPAPAGANLGSWEGLLAALTEMCADPVEYYLDTCPSEHVVSRMCLGTSGCPPVALLHGTNQQPRAFLGDPETGLVTYIHVGRNDDFPAAARYGGTVTLLKSILGQLGVREPEPGESPG